MRGGVIKARGKIPGCCRCQSDVSETAHQPNGSYHIRLARPDEVPRLREIEDEAGTLFSGLGLVDEALDVSFPWVSLLA